MKKTLAVAMSAALLLPVLSGCVKETASSTSEVVFVGMMGAPTILDPAGTRRIEDAAFLQQIFPSVMNSDGGVGQVVPELGVSAEYTSEFEFTVELKPDLTFSNGHALTASDVVHSINRIKTIADPSGPVVLLQNLDSVTAVNDTTVVFAPTRALDQALPAVLASLAGLVVDEEVFPADRLLTNDEVVSSNAFAGPYTIGGYSAGSAIRLNPNPVYAGVWGVPTNKGVELRYYTNPDQLMYDSSEMLIDVAIAHRQSLTASTADASEAFAIDFLAAPRVETGLLFVNGKTATFTLDGKVTPRGGQNLRELFVDLFDSTAIAKEAFGELYPAALGLVPEQFGGAGSPGEDAILDGDKAVRVLEEAGVEVPMQVELSFPETLYGPSVVAAVTQVKTFIDATGAFEIVLRPLSDEEFLATRENLQYDVLYDNHYPLFADPEAFLFPLLSSASALGADAESITQLTDRLNAPDIDSYADHLRGVNNVESNLVKTSNLIPIAWMGRNALVRDGIQGGAEMLAADGKLVLAKLYRALVK